MFLTYVYFYFIFLTLNVKSGENNTDRYKLNAIITDMILQGHFVSQIIIILTNQYYKCELLVHPWRKEYLNGRFIFNYPEMKSRS